MGWILEKESTLIRKRLSWNKALSLSENSDIYDEQIRQLYVHCSPWLTKWPSSSGMMIIMSPKENWKP